MNVNSDSLQAILQEVQSAVHSSMNAADRQQIWRKMHLLAEHQLSQAQALFLALLEHPDWSWRVEALEDLGFHYQLQPESQAVERIRQLALNDPSDFVRMTAASVLGIRSVWPEQVLLNLLDSETEKEVLEAAFEASLTLAGFPRLDISKVMDKIKSAEIPATKEQLQALIDSLE